MWLYSPQADEVKRVRTRKYALADKITTKGGVVVPGTTVRSTQRSGEVHFTQKRWTDFVIEFKAVEERAKVPLDAHGKTVVGGCMVPPQVWCCAAQSLTLASVGLSGDGPSRVRSNV